MREQMTAHQHASFEVAVSYDCTSVVVQLTSWPLSVMLGRVSPEDARKFAAMLTENADTCDRIAKESTHLSDIHRAMLADEVSA